MLSTIMFLVFVSWVVIYASFRLTKVGLGMEFNGIGAVPNVLAGTTVAPMQYRVLIPWICKVFSKWLGPGPYKFPYFHIYMRIHWIGVCLAMVSSFVYFTTLGVNPFVATSLLALYLVLAAFHDYIDIYLEIAGFCTAFVLMAFSGPLVLSALFVLCVLAALNKETAIFIPITATFTGVWPVMVVAWLGVGIGLWIPRLVYGKRESYCAFNQIPVNWRRFINSFDNGMPNLFNNYIVFVMLVGFGLYAYGRGLLGGALSPIEQAMGLFFLVMLMPSVWKEVRVFAPTMLAIIPMMIRGF